MSLKQINLAFDAEQDRILMRISTHDAVEYRAWLTRRIVAGLLPAIDGLLERDAASHSPARSPEAQRAVSEFRHQHAVDRARFTAGYEAATPAFGDEPLLITRIQLRQLDAEQFLMVLAPPSGDALQLRLGEVLLHGTIKLLRDTVRAAQWNLGDADPAPRPGQPDALVN